MAKLFKLLAFLTVAVVATMHPFWWYAWGIVFVLFAIAWCVSVWRGMA